MKTDFYDLFGNKLKKLYSESKQELLETNNLLDEEVEVKIYEILENIDRYMNYCERLKLNFGQLLDYNSLKKNGFSKEQLEDFYQEDKDYISSIDEYYENNIEKRDMMFGYPANMQDYSYSTQYLRYIESKLYLMNNCGDPYQIGNYGMDSKDIEQQIISLFAHNFGLKEGEYWGYISTGGTESNFWGIREGFNKFPQGKLYFSADTHYSVEKFATNNEQKLYNYEIIDSNSDGTICTEKLFAKIKEDAAKGVKGVILVLTWGTTCRGAIDEVKKITDYLIENNIDYYCHLDAAHFGGIPQNQIDAPSLKNIRSLNVDSIAISMHKFIGTARVNGVVMALSRQNRKVIDYIGQEDSTLLGSRDYLPFSTFQRAKDILLRSPENTYSKNVVYFKSGLQKYQIPYEQFKNGNIFVVAKPNDEICKKFQLATFRDVDGKDKAHIIIFPFHKQYVIDKLIKSLVEDMNKWKMQWFF